MSPITQIITSHIRGKQRGRRYGTQGKYSAKHIINQWQWWDPNPVKSYNSLTMDLLALLKPTDSLNPNQANKA